MAILKISSLNIMISGAFVWCDCRICVCMKMGEIGDKLLLLGRKAKTGHLNAGPFLGKRSRGCERV